MDFNVRKMPNSANGESNGRSIYSSKCLVCMNVFLMTDFKLLFKYPVFWCMIFYNNNNKRFDEV